MTYPRRASELELARLGASGVVNDTGTSTAGVGRDASPAEPVAAEIQDAGGTALATTESLVDCEAAGRIIEASERAGGEMAQRAANLRAVLQGPEQVRVLVAALCSEQAAATALALDFMVTVSGSATMETFVHNQAALTAVVPTLPVASIASNDPDTPIGEDPTLSTVTIGVPESNRSLLLASALAALCCLRRIYSRQNGRDLSQAPMPSEARAQHPRAHPAPDRARMPERWRPRHESLPVPGLPKRNRRLRRRSRRARATTPTPDPRGHPYPARSKMPRALADPCR
jgi:hypothetical protein